MTTIEQEMDVGVPVRTAYNQWTQFESFPRFMRGVERVVQVEDNLTHWETRIGGVHRQFDAEIIAQLPDEVIAWSVIKGPAHGGMVTFHPLDAANTRVTLEMRYQPGTLTERVGDALGYVNGQVASDLRRFRDYIEQQGRETGAWRGTIGASAPATEPLPQRLPPKTDPALGDMPVRSENFHGQP